MNVLQAAEGTRTDADAGTVRELRLKLNHCQEEICKLQAVINEVGTRRIEPGTSSVRA